MPYGLNSKANFRKKLKIIFVTRITFEATITVDPIQLIFACRFTRGMTSYTTTAELTYYTFAIKLSKFMIFTTNFN